jgi:hypothetical protein
MLVVVCGIERQHEHPVRITTEHLDSALCRSVRLTVRTLAIGLSGLQRRDQIGLRGLLLELVVLRCFTEGGGAEVHLRICDMADQLTERTHSWSRAEGVQRLGHLLRCAKHEAVCGLPNATVCLDTRVRRIGSTLLLLRKHRCCGSRKD